MWQSARPHPEAFIVLDGIRETHIPERAFSAQRLRNPHRILAGDTIGEILGEENFGNILTRCATVSVNGGTEMTVCALSVAGHNLSLKEEPNER